MPGLDCGVVTSEDEDSTGAWIDLAEGVLARRCAELDLTVGLVVGRERALVVDVGGDRAQGAQLAREISGITGVRREIVFTHGHFDHCFGAAAFAPAPAWAHAGCAEHLRATAERQRADWIDHYRGEHKHEIADALARTEIRAPDHLVGERAELDLGGRVVRLRHLGAGHTDHDLVVQVPDCGIVFAGDLVEHGAPPDFEDSLPQQWPSTVDRLLDLDPKVIVPGHGDPADPEFARGQRDELAAVAELRAAHHRGEIGEAEAIRRSPYPAGTTRSALAR